MKNLLFGSLLVLLQSNLFAQFNEVARSKSFREPAEGYMDIVQLKNGHTALIVKELKKTMELKIYDEKHLQKVSKQIRPKFPLIDNAGSRMRAVFEINGQLVFFFRNVEDRVPVLRRMIIDPANGSIVREDKLGELRRELWGFSRTDFYIIKDPNSDQYAVALSNESEKEPTKRLTVIMYNGRHEETARARYEPSPDNYDMVNFTDIGFMGPDLYCLGFASKLRSKGKENVVFTAALAAGQSSFRHTELNFTLNKDIQHAMMRYNPVSKRIMLLTYIPGKQDWTIGNTWLYHLELSDPNNKTGEEIQPVAIQQIAAETFGKREKFDGVPVNLFVYEDGSYTLAFEDIEDQTQRLPSAQNAIPFRIGDLGLMHYNADRQHVKSWLLPKEHFMWAGGQQPFYHHRQEECAVQFNREDQFKTFQIARVDGKDYVFYNDLAKNEEKVEKGKNKRIIGITFCSAFSFPLGPIRFRKEACFSEKARGRTTCGWA